MLERIRRFRRQVQKTAGPREPGRRFPRSLKEEAVRILELRREDGATLHAVAADLGIPAVTMKRWAEALGGTVTSEPVGFRQVAVLEDDLAVRPVLLLADGSRVEGLDLANLAELIRRLR